MSRAPGERGPVGRPPAPGRVRAAVGGSTWKVSQSAAAAATGPGALQADLAEMRLVGGEVGVGGVVQVEGGRRPGRRTAPPRTHRAVVRACAGRRRQSRTRRWACHGATASPAGSLQARQQGEENRRRPRPHGRGTPCLRATASTSCMGSMGRPRPVVPAVTTTVPILPPASKSSSARPGPGGRRRRPRPAVPSNPSTPHIPAVGCSAPRCCRRHPRPGCSSRAT